MDNSRAGASTPGVSAATESDRAALADLVARATAADGVEPLSEHARLHAGRGGGVDLAVPGDDGRLAGFAHLDVHRSEPATAELVVDPDARGRGLGTALVEALVTAMVEQGGAGELRMWAHGRLPGAVALAERLGLRPVRELRRLSRPLTGPDVEPAPDADLPPDLRLRAFRVGVDEAEWLRVNALAFVRLPEQGGWTLDDLRDREGTAWFDAEGFLLAEVVDQPGTIAGFHWTKQHPREDGPPLGEVYVVGLDPAYQGRGLGTVLTLAGLRYLHGRGLTEVMLYVDGDNAAALATYARLGFETELVDVMYAAPSH